MIFKLISQFRFKTITFALTLALALGLSSTGHSCDCANANSSGHNCQQTASAQNVSAQPSNQPFARVYLALNGCTSCAACRSAIRQLIKGSDSDGDVALSTDAVEIVYDKPAELSLTKVVTTLAKNRLHNLQLVDVLFEADGTVAYDSDSSLVFVMPSTNQKIKLTTANGQVTPKTGEFVHLNAVVRGWRESGENLNLEIKSCVARQSHDKVSG